MDLLEQDAEEILVKLIDADPLRCRALEVLFRLKLPQGCIAAGFVRNLVWDYLHKKTSPTELSDIDVIYFDAANNCSQYDHAIEENCKVLMPEVNWQVRNQARMHVRNGDPAYTSAVDAMAYWPEKETAVAVIRNQTWGLDFFSPFDQPLRGLFAGCIHWNAVRDKSVFQQRLRDKRWLQHWPNLSVVESI
ncbi:nucleotidyltransferase family protein [Gilvimarinus sp. SDUM040013]|uniref:Nucleotidyltransferase family protein n=1 Tax=Gilvimarinus gilvus TaxID=3058038 RepID=A0ABU4RTR3_9GAMM|nr:nucleotidyltransferase family protein [Gilvimarinus sp. SDUM040013]MDO3386793.1 nucleotidyltransferase family protein [Gilvimarinus sp. SDUM040013]MDX6848277.1 nucleotidyltransferase family protein [Gilvimarinus sp. SDUM040013]